MDARTIDALQHERWNATGAWSRTREAQDRMVKALEDVQREARLNPQAVDMERFDLIKAHVAALDEFLMEKHDA